MKQKSPVEVSFSSGASQNLFALLFTAPADGYAFGLDGLVLRTRDGTRWEIIRRRENTDGTIAPTICSPPPLSTAAYRPSANEARCFNPIRTTRTGGKPDSNSTPQFERHRIRQRRLGAGGRQSRARVAHGRRRQELEAPQDRCPIAGKDAHARHETTRRHHR